MSRGMKRSVPLAAGLLLTAAFIIYALSGSRASGPFDKLVQLLLLVPAALCIAVFLARSIRKDLVDALRRAVRAASPRSFIMLASAVLLLFTVWMALFPLEGIPKGGDEVAYFFQSKVFAEGRLSAPVPPVTDPRGYFPFRHFIFRDGMWLIMYTPTHALAMAPFTLAGCSWLLGPLEGVLILIGMYLLVRTLSSELYARTSVLLLLLSPFYILMIPTHMAHNTNLLFVTWSLLLLAMGWKRDRALFSVLSGLLLGAAFTTKPYPIIAWGISITIYMTTRGRKGIRHLACMLVGSLPPAAYLLATNLYYTGNPLHTTYELARGGSLVGFGKGSAYYPIYGSFDHTVVKGLRNVVQQFFVGSVALYGWPGISGLPVLAGIWAGWKRKGFRWLVLPPALLAAMLVAHYAPAIAYGPRHYFTMLPVFVFLSAYGLVRAAGSLRRRQGVTGSNTVVLFVAGLFCISLFVYLPEEISLRAGPWQAIDTDAHDLAVENARPPAVVFMQADEHGYPNICSGLLFNSPFLTGDYVFCAHQTPDNDRGFMKLFPDHSFYLYWQDGSGSHLEKWSGALAEELVPSDSMRLEER